MAEVLERQKPVVDQIFGDNKAPVEEVLKADFADLIAKIDAAIDRTAQAPKRVKDEADLAKIGDAILGLKALAKQADETRTTEGKPILDAQRAINGFFKALVDRIGTAIDPLQDRADDYARRKQAEAQERARREAEEARQREEDARQRAAEATTAAAAGKAAADAEAYAARADQYETAATGSVKMQADGVKAATRGTWTARIDDYKALDLNALKPFIDRKAVEAALKSMARIQKDAFDVPGATAFQETKTQFRK